jgi:tetratricopeptide (TPR) repeat protein
MEKSLKSVMIPVLVALAISAVPVQLGYGQLSNGQGEDDRGSVNMLLDLFEKANNTLYNALVTVEDRGVALPEVVWANFDRGLETAKEAVAKRDAENYAEAKQKALEAMQRLRDVALDVGDDLDQVETEDEHEARIAAGIEAAADRINARIGILQAIAENAEAQGIDASKITERLGNVTELLNRIKEHIEQGDIDEAADDMGMSQQEFGKAMAALKPVVDTHKADQAASYLDNVEERLSTILDMINSTLSELPIPEPVKDLIMQQVDQALQTAQSKIAEARAHLQEGDVEDIMPVLDELREVVPGLMAELRGNLAAHKPDLGDALEDIDRYQLILDVLEDKAEILEEKGVDTAELQAKIQELHDLILDTVAGLKAGEDVEQLLAQIGSFIEEIEALVDQLETGGESS